MTTDRWTAILDKTTTDFEGTFGRLTVKQLNWKPHPQIWSVAQNIEHLIIINTSYFPALTAIRAGRYTVPLSGRIGVLVDFLGASILRSVQPDRRKKMKTFSVWEPASTAIDGNILDRFKQHQEDLKMQIINSESVLKSNPVISSPANRYIVYRLQTAFDIIVAHEQRHYLQASELLPHLVS